MRTRKHIRRWGAGTRVMTGSEWRLAIDGWASMSAQDTMVDLEIYLQIENKNADKN